jgi:hypothetical protein
MATKPVSNTKPRPDHVPEENVYEKMHWMVIVTYVCAAVAVAAMIINAG